MFHLSQMLRTMSYGQFCLPNCGKALKVHIRFTYFVAFSTLFTDTYAASEQTLVVQSSTRVHYYNIHYRGNDTSIQIPTISKACQLYHPSVEQVRWVEQIITNNFTLNILSWQTAAVIVCHKKKKIFLSLIDRKVTS